MLLLNQGRKAIEDEKDIVSIRNMLEHANVRISVGDTDIGVSLKQQIDDLNQLLDAYRKGIVKVKEV